MTEENTLALPGGEELQAPDDGGEIEQFFAQCREGMEQGGMALATANFAEAAQRFEEVERFAGGALEAAGDDLPDDLRDQVLGVRLGASAWKEFSIGIENMRGRTPGVAIKAFQNAAPLFRELAVLVDDPDYEFFADYAEINEKGAHGLEDLVRLNFSSAAATFQFALGQIETMIDETVPTLLARAEPSAFVSALGTGLEIDRSTYQAAFELASLRDLSSKGNFEEALPHALEREKLLRQALDALPAQVPKPLKVIVQAGVELASSEANLTEAHMWRDKAEWDKALESYQKARSVMQKTAAVVSKSNLAEAAAIQESLLNQAGNVIVMQLQCKRQQQASEKAAQREVQLLADVDRVRDEFKAFQNAIFVTLKTAGSVTNNTTLDLTNAVKQTATLSQQMTVSVRNAFSDLRAEAEKAPLAPEVKSQILDKADEAIELAQRGTDTLGRVKELGTQVIDVIRGAGQAAVVLLPAARILATVLGIPVPF